MGLKIWKPTCPSCGGGLDIREGQLYVQCENCGSSLIIEGWETRPKLPVKVPTEDYKSWPMGITFYLDKETQIDILGAWMYCKNLGTAGTTTMEVL